MECVRADSKIISNRNPCVLHGDIGRIYEVNPDDMFGPYRGTVTVQWCNTKILSNVIPVAWVNIVRFVDDPDAAQATRIKKPYRYYDPKDGVFRPPLVTEFLAVNPKLHVLGTGIPQTTNATCPRITPWSWDVRHHQPTRQQRDMGHMHVRANFPADKLRRTADTQDTPEENMLTNGTKGTIFEIGADGMLHILWEGHNSR